MKTVAFVGGGSFGTALSTIVAAKGCRVNIYDIDQDHLARMEADMENKDYLPGVKLKGDYHFCKTNEEAISDADFVIFALPAQHVRSAISEAAHDNHLEISGGLEDLRARYMPSLDTEESDTERALMGALFVARENDIRRGTTTVGPHRDDLMLTLSGVDVRVYGSQGQQRTTALSLKLAELDIMRRELGEAPVLMLDDVMSELDPKRRRHLLGRLRGIQTIVTCTDLSDLAEAEIGAAWRIQAGEIVSEGGDEA